MIICLHAPDVDSRYLGEISRQNAAHSDTGLMCVIHTAIRRCTLFGKPRTNIL
jgi:hypothetical protein